MPIRRWDFLCRSRQKTADDFSNGKRRRPPLQFAISTAGNSLALAQRLEQQFGSEYPSWVKELGELRRRLFSEPDLDPDTRRKLLHEQASAEAFKAFRNLRNTELSCPEELR
ncbi:MAG: hypothetical protein WAN03_22265 [Candidatus Sulfotelmatobacter sp.]